MDRLTTMAVFVSVAEEGGFAVAARKLGLSPPSVTRAVSELETRLGALLFHRTTRSVRLTDAGERFLADCQPILSAVEEAEHHAAGIHTEPSGTVTVSASALFGRMVVAPILLDVLDRYHKISVAAYFVDRVTHLMEEGIDVAVRIAELPDSALASSRVGQVRRVLCAAPGYLAARDRPTHPADLANHEIVEFGHMTTGGEWAFDDGSKSHRFRPQSRFLVNNADTAIAAAVAGRGITRVLSYMIVPQRRAGTLEVILDDFEPPPVPVHVLHKEPGQTSARVRAVVDHLVQSLRASQQWG